MEFSLGNSISEPTESHVNGLAALLLDGAIDDQMPLAVVLSVLDGVGG